MNLYFETLLSHYKRLKIIGDWKSKNHLVTIKDLGYLGTGLRTKDQSPWDDLNFERSLAPLKNK